MLEFGLTHQQTHPQTDDPPTRPTSLTNHTTHPISNNIDVLPDHVASKPKMQSTGVSAAAAARSQRNENLPLPTLLSSAHPRRNSISATSYMYGNLSNLRGNVPLYNSAVNPTPVPLQQLCLYSRLHSRLYSSSVPPPRFICSQVSAKNQIN